MIYTPREDSFLLEREVRKYAKGKVFLDLGAGSEFKQKQQNQPRQKQFSV